MFLYLIYTYFIITGLKTQLATPNDNKNNLIDVNNIVNIDDEDDNNDGLTDLYSVPFLTVKRLFTARNSGNLPITISSMSINGSPCEG